MFISTTFVKDCCYSIGVQKRARAFVPSDTLQNMYNINFLGHSTVICRRGEDTSETQNRSSVNY